MKLEISFNFLVLFWYIVHVALRRCSCHRLYSSKYFCPFLSYISILVYHAFIEPAPIFQWDQIQTAFQHVFMAAPLHTFHILSDFGFQPLTLVCLRFCLAKEINKPSQTSLVYLTTCLMFKAYLFALEFPLSKVQQFISPIIKITLYFFVAFVLYMVKYIYWFKLV